MTSERIAYSREDAARQVGVSVYKVMSAIRSGELPARRHGKDITVSHADLVDWYNSWPAV